MTHVPPASPHELAIRVHAQAINECNQRGGRMLSLIDLIDAGTVDLPLAAYLATTMRAGASLLVGARPGGAGKTAVMCALINFLPDDTTIRPAENAALLANASRVVRPGTACYLAHEIGRGSYYAYIWGREARLFFALAAQGHIVASNLHADTLEETRAQLCRDNGVDPTHLAAVTLKVYLRVESAGGWSQRRYVEHVYESDGQQDRLLWRRNGRSSFERLADSAIVAAEQEDLYTRILDSLCHHDIRRIEHVRQALICPSPDDPRSHP
jgi:hypothetical protein